MNQSSDNPIIQVQIPKPFELLFTPACYNVFYGGSNEAKSLAFAVTLLILVAQKTLHILCIRNFNPLSPIRSNRSWMIMLSVWA